MALLPLRCPPVSPLLLPLTWSRRSPAAAGGAAGCSPFRVWLLCETGGLCERPGRVAVPTGCFWQKLPVLPLRTAWPRPALGEVRACALLVVWGNAVSPEEPQRGAREGRRPWWLTRSPFLALAAQRSAQELPLVEKQSTASCPVVGGKRMVLSGHNFLQDSKVIFVEKAPGTVCTSVVSAAWGAGGGLSLGALCHAVGCCVVGPAAAVGARPAASTWSCEDRPLHAARRCSGAAVCTPSGLTEWAPLA